MGSSTTGKRDQRVSGEQSNVDAEAKNAASTAKKPRAVPSMLVRGAAERQCAPGAAGARDLKAVSWNVAGLRSFFNAKSDASEGKCAMLRRVWEEEQPDVLFLAEHKLQAVHIEATERNLKDALGVGEDFDGEIHWNVSTERKGYSGVVCILRHARQGGAKARGKQTSIASYFGGAGATRAAAEGGAGTRGFALLDVTFGLGEGNSQALEYNNEGRVITVEFDKLFVVSAYVPNSGDGLKRLDYRLKTWERDMNAHLTKLDEIKPVIYIGDMNVAHLDIDIHNVGAKHTVKQAGLTPQEREAFGAILTPAAEAEDPAGVVGVDGMVDSFRHFHPDALHWYSYWSLRAGNHHVNRGLRLDYALISRRCTDSDACAVRLADSFLLTDIKSDHCPVGVSVLSSL